MSGQALSRWAAALAALAVLAGAVKLEHDVRRCSQDGKRFVPSSWTCEPLPPIHLERSLKRAWTAGLARSV